MEQSSYPTRVDQPSPPCSLPDHNWKTETSHPITHVNNKDVSATLLIERLAKLAHAATQDAHVSSDDATTVHQCLDTLESLLDPRPGLTQQVVKCRPQNANPGTTHFVTPTTTHPSIMPAEDPLHPQLMALLQEVRTLNAEVNQRRRESSHIYELLTRECRRLSRKVSELEDEIHELETDMVEDSAEREALQGTVRGLESWVSGWQNEIDTATLKSTGHSRKGRTKRWMKRKPEERTETDAEALLDGIAAWMRGWKDVEEGFQIRGRNREMRRLERKKRSSITTESPGDI
ncbi:hypothetical protein BDV25DRAFT_167173 [Aspergillus avenaceus]|uniref:Uncharacterized protein n=1 Tax=Aspergillus avenaceus TaxID=36643 RepID=A0A5N6TDB7_ASPAV|nr:hypothetical protein BDV25DRAFT_167173 [Aspergillus avenaceus]